MWQALLQALFQALENCQYIEDLLFNLYVLSGQQNLEGNDQ